MKNEEHSSLWRSIQQFPLDDANAAITFSGKLSAKQNWSPAFTERVVEEYRKFIFLCCISPNGASPSQAVDEAWHLHLTYTKSYWIDLCKNTLNKDIHHHPTFIITHRREAMRKITNTTIGMQLRWPCTNPCLNCLRQMTFGHRPGNM
jgi:hypothetical protein